MRIQRRQIDEHVYWVEVDEGDRPLAAALERSRLVDGRGDVSPALLERLAGPGARIGPPSAPSKIVCIGLNYRRHAEEMNMPLPEVPVMFLKPSTAVIASGEVIRLPGASREVHYEGELAVVIGREARHVTPETANEFILGYTLMNDVTARDIQRTEGKYTRAKGFDTFAPLGPSIVGGLDPSALHLEVRLNGEVRQSSPCDDMIFKVPELVAFVSSVMTLLPGDVISTGTPPGVGPMQVGDRVEVIIAEIGTLANPVVAEDG